MKRALLMLLYLIMFLLILSFVLVTAGPFVYWHLKPALPLEVWILDKTVPVKDYREHRGLMWVLNNNKVINQATGTHFALDTDYYGFFPIDEDNYNIRSLPTEGERPDLIYLADTFGVYKDDYLQDNRLGTRSDIIYGGLSFGDIEIIQRALGGGNTIIGEFNIAADPTHWAVRKELSTIFGVEWSGWRARYFEEMRHGVEVPGWLIADYERQYQRHWGYRGPGITFVNDDERVIVLEVGTHVNQGDTWISLRDEYIDEFGIEGEVPYYYWFECITPLDGREVLADYRLDLTPAGRELLEEHGVKESFPAIVRFDNSHYTAYYFAGDFADYENVDSWWKHAGFPRVKAAFSSPRRGEMDYFYWRFYVPLMNKIVGDIQEFKSIPQHELPDGPKARELHARVSGSALQIRVDGHWEDIFIKGLNLGPAMPGRWFTEFPRDERIYLNWLEQMGRMNANSVRVYTLLPPEFYRALEHYNRSNPDNILWLFQEIWPEEHPEHDDLLGEAYVEDYKLEIEFTIDAVHGAINIPPRRGRAYGIYTADVSPYILGYLVGREIEPHEVYATDTRNVGYTFSGDYLFTIPDASPSEAWFAMSCDYVLAYQERMYGMQHPVSIVSWPTLDVLVHDSEWNEDGDKSREKNDWVSVDINNIELGPKMQAGFFGSYHIYPNYPDFMNNEPSYDLYHDEHGRFRYGGYLRQFMEVHQKYPALVAEFGLSTGMGNAHGNPDGYSHGGMTEEEQGHGTVRMMEAMRREGYVGGLIFEWMDEWAKKTWTTEPFMIPYERQVFWHNAIDPEQNYGIYAYEAKPPQAFHYVVRGTGDVRELRMAHDASYLHLRLSLADEIDLSQQQLLVGIDTYDRSLGEFRLIPDLDMQMPYGLEFLLVLSDLEAGLYVHPGYNKSTYNYASYQSAQGHFEEIAPMINKERVAKDGTVFPAIYEEGSRLHYGAFEGNSYYHWYIEDGVVHVRIPWGRLNVTDPSSMQVLHDLRQLTGPERDELSTLTTEGIMLVATVYTPETHEVSSLLITPLAYYWESWIEPQYVERKKSSYFILQQYFAELKRR